MPSAARRLSPLDRLLDGLESALETVSGHPLAARPSPGDAVADARLADHDRRRAGGLMRVNHTGEVCAQALYKGQALVARDTATAEYLDDAAAEETDHLAWCATRLGELDTHPSLLNPVWYAGSYAIGTTAALMSDRVSLGFVAETERQVEAHLARHIARLPVADERSRAILEQMQVDEARHGDNALARGGVPLPPPVPLLMRGASMVMKAVAYWV